MVDSDGQSRSGFQKVKVTEASGHRYPLSTCLSSVGPRYGVAACTRPLNPARTVSGGDGVAIHPGGHSLLSRDDLEVLCLI